MLETDSSLFYWEPFGEKAHAGPRRGGVGGREGGLRAAWPRLLLKPRVGVRASVSDSYSMNHETGHRTRLQQEQQGSAPGRLERGRRGRRQPVGNSSDGP